MNEAIRKYLKAFSFEQRISEYANIMRLKNLFGIEYVIELINGSDADKGEMK